MERSIGDRVSERREELGLSLPALADLVGVKYQTIQDLESGKSRGTKHILALAAALKVRPAWLQEESGPKEPSNIVHNPDELIEIGGAMFARLPVFDIRFAAGAGATNYDETPIDYHLLSLQFLRSLSDAPVPYIAIFQADGDSMEPTINSRDWVVVDRRRTRLTNPGIYALVFEGDGLLKRASQHLETGVVRLVSDNPKYPAQTIKRPERLQVVGRVILSLRRH